MEFALSPVLPRIFKFLDSDSRNAVRQVCRFWKEELDEDGLNIYINNEVSGNPEFASNRVLQQVNIVQVDGEHKYVHLKHPSLLNLAKCSGKIQPIWFVKELLQKCQNLSEIYLVGHFLISQKIANPKRILPSSSIWLDNLKVLRIELGIEDCLNYLSLQEPEGTVRKLIGLWNGHRAKSLHYLRETVDSNVTYLLNQIRALNKLNLLYIFADPMRFIDGLDYEFEWKREPIEVFLDFHRDSLRRLYLPYFEAKDFFECSWRLIPAELKTIEIYLHPFDPSPTRKPSYMERVLLCQGRLEEIRLNTNCKGTMTGGGIGFEPLSFKRFILNNACTLKYLHLNLSFKEKEVLDGKNFQECIHLEVFVLENGHNPNKFYNLCKLPKSLRVLKIRSALVLRVEEGELLGLSKFPKLETLELLDIRIKPFNLKIFTLTIVDSVMSALRLRNLNTLLLGFANEILMIRDQNLTGAIVQLGESVDAWVDIYEPFNCLEIYGPLVCNQHFMDEPAEKRVNKSHSTKLKSAIHNLGNLRLDEITVNSNVYNSSACEAFEECCSCCACGNPAFLDDSESTR